MAEKIGDVIEELLKEKGFKQEIDLRKLRRDWEDIVGGLMGKQLEVVEYRNKELLVRGSDPGWSHQAQMMKDKIKKAVNEHFDYNLVEEIRVIN